MILKQYHLDCLAHASYLIADKTSGQAAVVDAQRDVGQYAEDAARQAMTPFFDTDAIVVTNAFAKRHGLTMIADLKKLRHFTLGAESAFLSRQEGAAGMRSKYGLTNFTLKPLALGLQYQALDVGDITAADAFTTDPQLAGGKYRLLSDPKNIFGFQNIIVVIDKSKLAQLGGQTFRTSSTRSTRC